MNNNNSNGIRIKVDEDNNIEISKNLNYISLHIEEYSRKENKFEISDSYIFGIMTPEEFKELFSAAYEYLKNYKEK